MIVVTRQRTGCRVHIDKGHRDTNGTRNPVASATADLRSVCVSGVGLAVAEAVEMICLRVYQ